MKSQKTLMQRLRNDASAAGLSLLLSVFAASCGTEDIENPPASDAGTSYDAGYTPDSGAKPDAGNPQQDSGSEDTGSGENKMPVPVLRYSWTGYDGPWTEAKDGDVINKPLSEYEGGLYLDPCASYDSDGNIVEMTIDFKDDILGENSFALLKNGKCHKTGNGGDEYMKPHTETATLKVKDDKGAESKLSVTFTIE